MKFYPQQEAYTEARQFFLEHDYTHFIILPDGLIVEQMDIDLLLDECEDDVLSGWCNNTADGSEDRNDSNFSYTLPPDPPHQGRYDDYNFVDIESIEQRLKAPHTPQFQIIFVKHSGFALTVLPRKIIENIPFRSDDGCCVDACLSLDLDEAKIPQYVDLRVRTKQIKITNQVILVGKRRKEIVLRLK